MRSRTSRVKRWANRRKSAGVSHGSRRNVRITVDTMLPLSVAYKARREVYTYPYPRQRQLRRFNIREKLKNNREKFVPVRLKLSVPARLPLVKGSYVSWRDGRQTIHSRRQLVAALERGETNRRRRDEGKRNRRKASHGQADSPGALGLGLVSYAVHHGYSPGRIADQALAARAIGGF